MSNFVFLAWAWCAVHGYSLDVAKPPQWVFTDLCDGKGYCLTDWWVEGVPRPTDAELRALQPEADAEARATESLRKETPIKYDQPIQARIELLVAPDHVCRLEVDRGQVFAVEIESERLTPEAYAAAVASNLIVRAQHRERILAIKTDLDQVEAALDQIDVGPSSSYATNIAACTGPAKTALQDTRKALVDVKSALKNLRQASELVRREIR
jgi:hypothetical protein